MVWNISIGQLVLAVWLCSFQLRYTCSLPEYGRPEKVLDFTATAEIISVINILLVLKPEHRSYWEEN